MTGNATVEAPVLKSPGGFEPLGWRAGWGWGLVAIAGFHAAYTPAKPGLLAFCIVGYVGGLMQLSRLRTTRQCFYSGLGVGFACFAPQLEFFRGFFGLGAVALWLVLALWIAFFVALTRHAVERFGLQRAALLMPFLWTGLEYFRSELYYLKFSWLNAGYAFAQIPLVPFRAFGMYGIGFMIVAGVAFVLFRARNWLAPHFRWQLALGLLLLAGFVALMVPVASRPHRQPNLIIAGVQLEFPTPVEIRQSLDRIISSQTNLPALVGDSRTNVDLIVLSEYTLDGPPTEPLKKWCRDHKKFLIIGGKEELSGTNYYNTAFVIGTNGEVVFQQVKSVPIQFFKDGLPAPRQQLWESPWGRIGIGICYDLSYTRVTDELVRQGAQLLIVPTMDVADWGRHQHELHARVAPARAAEYGVPIFRLASSGISQGIDELGRVRSSASFPGAGEMLFFGVKLNSQLAGALPWDRWLAPLCVVLTLVFVGWLLVDRARRWRKFRENQLSA